MEFCLNQATLHAYLDGELSPETLNGVALHLAACDTCAQAAHAAEAELAIFNTAFAPVMQASVPTEKLRARLDEAIAEMNASHRQSATRAATMRVRSFFESLVASLTTFTPRQATAFASLLVAVALAVVFFALMGAPDDTNSSKLIARNAETPAPAGSATRTDDNPARGDDQVAVQTPDKVVNTSVPARNDSGGASVANRSRFVKAAVNTRTQVARTRGEGGDVAAAPASAVPTATASEPVIEDEKTYLNSIASLTSAIEAQGAEGMTPTLRAEYARNLAVVNQAIVASRVAARRNPQDTDAKEFLRAAYQNKVELLSAVADQTQIASGRD
ncbi:MAG TPA: zf-HC2 domain-containing protein [Pyrinomonadaceae bacterium]|nr:zf-HC2 domain-containing protein [Pyrinomonadaceae bacterium]